jgi:2Fe-2S ferredoxin
MHYRNKLRILLPCQSIFADLREKPCMYTIHFTFEEKGLKPVTIENCASDDSILEVALKNKIEIHHNCGGVCACSTCHIYLDSGEEFVEELTDKEENFIDRARNPKLSSRLSCQCLLLGGQGELRVSIPDQSLIHGE